MPISAGGTTMMKLGGVFPSSVTALPASPPSYGQEWWPWCDNLSLGPQWPVRRVTFRQPGPPSLPTNQPLEGWVADRDFSTRDDLALELPNEHDKPVKQRVQAVDLNGDNKKDMTEVMARQSRGEYSWIVTVAPQSAEASDALATDPSAYTYDVSVVVFYKRVLPASPKDSVEMQVALKDVQKNERTAQAKILTTGLSGGEILLTRNTPTDVQASYEPDESPFDNLKTGNWIMLCGPHPNSTKNRPLMVSHWYRVLAIEGKGKKLDANGAITNDTTQPDRRVVSLRGPEWPWQPWQTGASSHLSDYLYVCIPSGAVAVHAKTIRLEGNSVFGGGANGVGSAPPPGGNARF